MRTGCYQGQTFPYYGQRYQAIKYRRGHKKAVIAIARMMLSVIYTLLARKELFAPEIYEEAWQKPAFLLSPEQQLLKLAKKFGYEVVKVPEPAPV